MSSILSAFARDSSFSSSFTSAFWRPPVWNALCGNREGIHCRTSQSVVGTAVECPSTFHKPGNRVNFHASFCAQEVRASESPVTSLNTNCSNLQPFNRFCCSVRCLPPPCTCTSSNRPGTPLEIATFHRRERLVAGHRALEQVGSRASSHKQRRSCRYEIAKAELAPHPDDLNKNLASNDRVYSTRLGRLRRIAPV